jgi:predicted lipoprotein with Yx(FWY)xxD motif
MRGRVVRVVLPLLVVGALVAGVAMAASASMHSSRGTVKAFKSSSFGMVLAASNGHTLYRYTPDSKGVNRCSSNATCNKFWPRLLVKASVKPTVGSGASASLIGTMKAAHGMAQVTYAGFPLYLFAGDTAAGQTKGQGFEGKWYVVNTRGALVKHALSTGSSSTSSGATTTTKSAWG